MTIIKKPAIYYPNNKIENKDIISFIEEYHFDSKYIDIAKEMISNTTIEQRYLFESFDNLMKIGGFSERQSKHELYAKKVVSSIAMNAIDNAKISKEDISMVIVTSCTGFMMPSLTAFLINELELKNTTIQLPISQMGCVGGAYAINRAYEHCSLDKNHNVLIVAFETSSLCFHKSANKLQDFVSDSIFGDGVASCIISANDIGSGLIIESTNSIFIKDSEDFIKYNITDDGFLFSLDKKVMKSISMIKKRCE
ncbi:type III polyketide synthase (plasmid) [Photobacterium damselae subsp. damselae]|uniref:type III polyketide synthase n=1 Tax=Photobacterium damselae TaxID=38293 RepID=UPI001F1E8BE7|nr:type III polyketide synthase [Photobacterium damselae]UJZ96598.1 type III polyketide synthase [Photobacterium damselae subsp. damselae]